MTMNIVEMILHITFYMRPTEHGGNASLIDATVEDHNERSCCDDLSTAAFQPGIQQQLLSELRDYYIVLAV